MLSFVLSVSPKALAEDGIFSSIDFPDAIFTTANDINPGGDIVGRHDTADGKAHGYVLSGEDFTSFDFPCAIFTTGTGINPQGDIVGIYMSDDGEQHGYLLSGGEFTSIDFPDATFTQAQKINPQGDIVGWYGSADGKTHGWLPGRYLHSGPKDQPSRRHRGMVRQR
jgi:hypothetical protein